ncbi:Protein MEMO1 [Hondaea fermentalgiana]|uniref:Protein MEMO1 n=1 Tax=Hondaea fermentalgiana TaxID=2315210 RepID=A0A2R5GU45_9STRA|nr:Protein MEMO1 [Hondaea fermentalgiana]|eukprot:GBG31911.1 Protein MEMO1 [Hondaea fermentalgiana]
MAGVGAAAYVRTALHASSWYSDRASELESQLAGWLKNAREKSPQPDEAAQGRCAAVIAPHAGYSYSGPTAAWAYKYIDPSRIKRVFILGPSHHVYLENCALSSATAYATPIGNMQLDADTAQELRNAAPSGTFGTMSRSVDEEEHSIEMHLPYVVHVMRGHDFKIVPILVGNLDDRAEQQMGALLAPYLADPENFFVISSDFCHWGKRFRYTPHDASAGPIHKSIENLDKRGMALIESLDVSGFAAYLRETRNTICGRHPIGVLLNAIQASPLELSLKFTHYAQSSPCTRMSDSSVSYASAVVTAPAVSS